MNSGYNGQGFHKVEAGQKYHQAMTRLNTVSQHPCSHGWEYIWDDEDDQPVYVQEDYLLCRFKQFGRFGAWGVKQRDDEEWIIFEGYTTSEVTEVVFGG